MDSPESDDITLLNLSLAIIAAIGGGVLMALFGVPIKIITSVLKKRTLWEFENIWLFVSTVGFVVMPLASIPALVPIPALTKLFSEGIIWNVEWVIPILFVTVWMSCGLMLLGLSIQQIGLGTACSLCFTVSIVISTVFKWIWASAAVLQDATGVIGEWSYMKLVIFLVAIPILLIGAVLLLVSSILLEKSTREVRMEFEVGIRHDLVLDRARFETKDNRAKLEKLQKKVSPEKMAIKHITGLVTACISGIFFPWFQFATIVPSGMIALFMEEAELNMLQTKVLIFGFSLPIASVFSLLVCFVLLVLNKSIKKYALCSGGFVALDNCTNFKGWRLVAAIVSSLMGIAMFCSFFLLVLGDWLLMSDRSARENLHVANFHYALWCGVALIVSNICGVLLQVINTLQLKATRKAERIISPVSIAVLALGFLLVGVATFPTNPIV